MKVLVLSKLSLPEAKRTIPDWDVDWVTVAEDPSEVNFTPDAIVSMGVGVMEQTYKAIERWSSVPLFCYNWDTYEWVWNNPRPGEYDYHRYGELLKQAKEIWVPSACTKRRTHQWWNLPSKVILSSCPYWDYENVRDGGYVFCSLREIPDRQWDWFEAACKSLGLPYKMSNHECSLEEYQDLVAGCKFIVSHLYEASTGGLTLLEAYYLGKPCLLSNSDWNGGVDYLEDRARYFGSYNGLKFNLMDMWENPLPLSRDQTITYVKEHFSSAVMISKIKERLDAYFTRA